MLRPSGDDGPKPGDDASQGRLIYRQNLSTRITHWVWAVCLFFLLLSGLQIFNAHPTLYVGKQSGFDFDNAVVDMASEKTSAGPRGITTVFGHRFDTTGVLGLSKESGELTERGFPGWATIPASQDLATGRVVHFFFAWLLVFTLIAWLVSSLVSGHLWRDIVPGARDFRRLPRDVLNHLRLRFHHTRRYNTLQKLTYAVVLFVLLPAMIVTGLCMSPGMDAAIPWLVDLVGGRQTARTIHFTVMTLLVAFFIVHILMVLAAGPFNEMRSMITGWYRSDRSTKSAAPVEK